MGFLLRAPCIAPATALAAGCHGGPGARSYAHLIGFAEKFASVCRQLVEFQTTVMQFGELVPSTRDTALQVGSRFA